MAETDAFCWVNGVGMAHEPVFRNRVLTCKRCGQTFTLERESAATNPLFDPCPEKQPAKMIFHPPFRNEG